jgi:hypothetical protein
VLQWIRNSFTEKVGFYRRNMLYVHRHFCQMISHSTISCLHITRVYNTIRIHTDLIMRGQWYPTLACLPGCIKWLAWGQQELLLLDGKPSVTFYPQLKRTDCGWIINFITQILVCWHRENVYNLKLKTSPLINKTLKSWECDRVIYK